MMTVSRSSRGPLLAGAGARLLIAAIAVLCLWCGVLWAYLAPPPPTVVMKPSGVTRRMYA